MRITNAKALLVSGLMIAIVAPSAGAAGRNVFVTKAAQDGMAEVELAEVAKRQAQSGDVKSFADKMASDHSKANDELKALAAQKGYTLPSEPSAAQKATKARLEKLSGAAFDRAYMSHMVGDHTKAVSLFRSQARAGSDADLKSWAAKTLPTLEEHLKMAKDVSAKTRTASHAAH